MTINGVASEGEPGDALCTLTNPSSFSTPGVSAFAAPTGAGSCPQLATETTYFVVIEWVDPSGTDSFALIPQTFPTEESAATGEDPGGAEGWSIADESYYLTASSNARTWTAYDERASFKIVVKDAAATAAGANSPATGLPTISGTAQVGETLTTDTSDIVDKDELTNVSYSYQWTADDTDIEGATDLTYELSDADVGKTIKVKVSFTDDAEQSRRSRTSAATATVAARPNSPPTGLPTISGAAQVGKKLTLDTSGIDDQDGLVHASFSYQWVTDNSDIAGASDSTYTLVDADEGKAIKVKVGFTDDRGSEETLTSAATGAVAPRPDNPVADEENPVWSADMLVVEYTSASIGAASANLFSNQGGSAGLQAQSLWSYTLGRELYLTFAEGVSGADDLTLLVGDLVLAFPAGSSGQYSFTWKDVDVDWENGQTIAVRIVPTSALVEPTPNSPPTGLPSISGRPRWARSWRRTPPASTTKTA